MPLLGQVVPHDLLVVVGQPTGVLVQLSHSAVSPVDAFAADEAGQVVLDGRIEADPALADQSQDHGRGEHLGVAGDAYPAVREDLGPGPEVAVGVRRVEQLCPQQRLQDTAYVLNEDLTVAEIDIATRKVVDLLGD
ncbi:hypothetical protein GCM10010348_70650 [Streptomyces anthocyanicus]|nr:hypothetical protein [Streptomyces anthocyanicus]GHC33599.1 hypothetical protein GCM10010348_70650 [Streptomyces anthocyanicus]